MDYEAIRHILLGVDRKPGLGSAPQARTHSVTIRLEATGMGRGSVATGRRAGYGERDRGPGTGRAAPGRGLGLAAFAGLREQLSAVLLPGALGQES